MEPDHLISPPPPPGGTRLVRTPREAQAPLTAHVETDCYAALTRGLKEYLQGLAIDWHGGRQSRFARVVDVWSDPEDEAEFPSAAVYSLVDGRYEAHDMGVTDTYSVPPYVMRKAAEYAIPLQLECWCTDRVERMAVSKMIEDAMNPVDWQAGLRLALPHYHDERGRYLLTGSGRRDGMIDARRRIMLVSFEVVASVSQIAFVGARPPFRPQIQDGDGDAGVGVFDADDPAYSRL